MKLRELNRGLREIVNSDEITLLGALAGTLADDITTYIGTRMYGIEAETSETFREAMEKLGPALGIGYAELTSTVPLVLGCLAFNRLEKYLGNVRWGNVLIGGLATLPSFYAALHNSQYLF